jgi:hypothetical protein
MSKKDLLNGFLTFICFIFLGISKPIQAQDFNNAIEYMDYISVEFDKISKDTWNYTSAASHGKKAKKVDNLRKEVINTVYDAIKKIEKMPKFNEDASLRDSMVSYLKLNYNVLKHDYEKIMDLEEISEQSYDMMEAYLKAQEIADMKLELAGNMIEAQQQIFADKHQVNLIYAEDKISNKLKEAHIVYDYYNIVYLFFFKSYKQEAYMLEALNKNDLNGIEQNNNALLNFSKDGLSKIDTLPPFKGDLSLKNAANQILIFYVNEAEVKVPILTDFLLKKENFEKQKKAIDAKPPSKRTNQEIDDFNKSVNDFNQAVKTYNTTNQELNKERNKQLDNWNKLAFNFLDKNVPKKK